MVDLAFSEILNHLLKYEGATVKREGKRFNIITYEDGYQVSMESPDDVVLVLSDDNLDELEQILMDIPEGQEFGLWVDIKGDNKLYIDYKTIHFDDINEALEAAEESNQLAIFDWEVLDSHYL